MSSQQQKTPKGKPIPSAVGGIFKFSSVFHHESQYTIKKVPVNNYLMAELPLIVFTIIFLTQSMPYYQALGFLYSCYPGAGVFATRGQRQTVLMTEVVVVGSP